MTHHNSRNQTTVHGKGKLALSLAMFFVLILLSVVYLSQVNKLIEKNFDLRNIRLAVQERQEQSQKLMVAFMQAGSLSSLEEAAKRLNLVEIGKTAYLNIAPDFFALYQKP